MSMLRSGLREYGRVVVVLSTGVLFLVLGRYESIGRDWADSLVFYGGLPLAAVLLMRRNPLDFGLRIGEWRVWVPYVLVTCAVALPILYGASRIESLSSYYTLSGFDLGHYAPRIIVELAAWEVMFRGYLLFGLSDRFKEGSILVQMVPFVLMHLGKPQLETISTIPMGLYLGWVAYRGNSFWPAAIIHIFINITFRVFANWV
ncbi:MAG: CPBP family intramembrane metalloprotease [Candidatus Altiarchaeales archaeon]|nr:CPBP family intramembrane metalloprotease [Candidatus Altiarchaeales archaeon]